MSVEHELVTVPREGANDDSALLIAWSKNDGDQVAKGDLICDLEFSKSVIEVPAPRDGWLFHLRQPGEDVPVGAPVAVVAARNERPQIDLSASRETTGVKVTAKARRLIETNGVDVAVFAGIDIVKEKHVRAWLEQQEPATDESAVEGELVALTPIRRRAAMALSESKRSIPHSYLCRWVAAAPLDARVQEEAGRRDMMLSVTDWVVYTVARKVADFPRANASWRANGIFQHSRANLGFALNLANGDLVVPVVPDAHELELEDLVGRIHGLQKKALRHKLTPQDLGGGTVTVTSLVGSGVHQIFPIIVPGQSLILAVGDRLDSDGSASYNLTVAFDHRVLNGSEAAEFLAAVADGLLAEPGE